MTEHVLWCKGCPVISTRFQLIFHGSILIGLFIMCSVIGAAVGARQSTPPADAKRIIAPRAREAILALKSRSMARLSRFVHPTKGVRFSPYQFIYAEKNRDRVFTSSQVKNLFTNKHRYLWGEDDASGEPIRMTFAAYYRRFVFDHDYSTAKQVGYNDQTMGNGTLVNNIRETYPQAIVVEYHFSGFEEKYGGMDWKSLWLIFEKDGSEWYLVGIVHGEWTT